MNLASTTSIPASSRPSDAQLLHDAFRATPQTHRVTEAVLATVSGLDRVAPVQTALDRVVTRVQRAQHQVGLPSSVPNTLVRQLLDVETGAAMLGGAINRHGASLEHRRSAPLADDILASVRRGVVAVITRPEIARDPELVSKLQSSDPAVAGAARADLGAHLKDIERNARVAVLDGVQLWRVDADRI